MDFVLNFKPFLKHFVQDGEVNQVRLALLLTFLAAVLEYLEALTGYQVG